MEFSGNSYNEYKRFVGVKKSAVVGRGSKNRRFDPLELKKEKKWRKICHVGVFSFPFNLPQ